MLGGDGATGACGAPATGKMKQQGGVSGETTTSPPPSFTGLALFWQIHVTIQL